MGEVLVCETWLVDDPDFDTQGDVKEIEGYKIDERLYDPEVDNICQLRELIFPQKGTISPDGTIVKDTSSFLELMPVKDGVRVNYRKDSLQSSFHIFEGAGYLSLEKGLNGVFPLTELRANNVFVFVNAESDSAKVWTIVDVDINGNKLMKFSVEEGEIFIQNLEGFPIASAKKGGIFYVDEEGKVTTKEGEVKIELPHENCLDSEEGVEVMENENLRVNDTMETTNAGCSISEGLLKPIHFSKEIAPFPSGILLIVIIVGVQNKILRLLVKRKVKEIKTG
ncbi:MAG: hypothetical protein RBS56_04360 [Candidatus Gracilibacteria bacterium]|jgi:hypothetical protein|nr:hypothetical protein [Candidatus Gracilibacteria bacterium]